MGEEPGTAAGDGTEPEGGRRYAGVVSRFEHGWGFIECEAMNRNYFVHYSDIEGTGLRSLEAGEPVSFELAPGKDGRPKAIRVRRQGVSHPAPRRARIQALPRLEVTTGEAAEDGEEAAPGGAKLLGLPSPAEQGA
ncbi:MAG TPA: cold shock domain-containing protein [bacterium]|nr:cold shock domain-containing protein [bacterium]